MPFIDTSTITVKAPRPGWNGRFFNSATMTFGYYDIVAGATIHAHAHPNEEVWHVLAGELEVTIGDETRIAGPGSVAVIPVNTTHAVRALTAGRAIVVDHPSRESIGGVELV